MRLRIYTIPLCECGDQMVKQSYQDGDGLVWQCTKCWRRYFVPWTYIDALVLPELHKDAVARKPE